MYMLNLLFDLGKDPADGLFEPAPKPAADTPLGNSSSWLVLEDKDGKVKKLPATDTPKNLKDGRKWVSVGDLKLYISDPKTHEIGVRIAPVTSSTPALDANSTLECVVAFGAPIPKAADLASPFLNDLPKDRKIFGVRTTFIHKANRPDDPADPNYGWFVPLSEIHHVPPAGGNRIHRYEFALGAIITVGGITYHFGLDPEMDVGF